MVTTIQLNEDVKHQLDKMKSAKETYEDIIVSMITQIDKQKREQTELMIEGCIAMAEESLKITKEFEAIEDLSAWEW